MWLGHSAFCRRLWLPSKQLQCHATADQMNRRPMRNIFGVQVDQYLRVKGHQRVFAVGDATDVKETKLGYLAKAQVGWHRQL